MGPATGSQGGGAAHRRQLINSHGSRNFIVGSAHCGCVVAASKEKSTKLHLKGYSPCLTERAGSTHAKPRQAECMQFSGQKS
jgi:hypothetical protein